MQYKKTCCVCSQNIHTEILNKSSFKKAMREFQDSSANENNTSNTISWLVLDIIMLMCSNKMKQRQCLLCQLSGLTPAWFLEAAPSLGAVIRLLACRQPDAFLVLPTL